MTTIPHTMTLARKRESRVRSECQKINDQWSEAKRARRCRLGALRRVRLLHSLSLSEKPHAV